MMLDAPLFLSVLARSLLDHPIVMFAALVTLRSESTISLDASSVATKDVPWESHYFLRCSQVTCVGDGPAEIPSDTQGRVLRSLQDKIHI